MSTITIMLRDTIESFIIKSKSGVAALLHDQKMTIKPQDAKRKIRRKKLTK